MWTVMLVEDEVFVRESVKELISWEELGFTVVGESGHGGEALELIMEKRPDLVLADIVMPGMDGLELLKKTRMAGLKTKFIMLTCMGEFEYVRQAMEYGASNYILKLSMSVNSLRETLGKLSAELAGQSAQSERIGQSGRIEESGQTAQTGQVPVSGAEGLTGGEGRAGHEGKVKGESPVEAEKAAWAKGTAAHEADVGRGGGGLEHGFNGAAKEAGMEDRENNVGASLLAAMHEPVVSHPEIGKIIAHIGRHYDQDITVKSMSRFVMMGENYVSALFKKKTGYTLIHYLHGVRVEKAADYLRTTDLPVHEIGSRVGFANDNYFIKIFKRWTGCTPSQYRQRSGGSGGNREIE